MHDVCVVGLGYVGLPTACAFANSGLDTIGVDNRSAVVEKVSRGESHLTEAGLGGAVRDAVKSGLLKVTMDLGKAVSESKTVMIAVQTPYEGGRVVLEHLKVACGQVADALAPGTLVILESTVPPGTCLNTVVPILQGEKRKVGKDFYFAYCPERMAPGDSLREFVTNERLIGGATESSVDRAEAFMRRSVTGRLTKAEITHIEVAKLVENTARDVYISFANDLAKMSKRLGVDAREVIRLANTHPRVHILNPGPGVGGPCLTKDPYLLIEGFGKGEDAPGVTARTARRVNDGMNREVIGLVEEGGAPPPGSKIAVLGTSYKPEVGDPRGSPTRPVVEELLRKGYDVWAYDPYCVEGFGAKVSKTVEEATEGASCLLLMVAHKQFLGIDFQALARRMSGSPKIVDAVGIPHLVFDSADYRLARLGDGTGPRPSGRA